MILWPVLRFSESYFIHSIPFIVAYRVILTWFDELVSLICGESLLASYYSLAFLRVNCPPAVLRVSKDHFTYWSTSQ